MEQYVENNTKGKISKFANGHEKNQSACIYYFERHKLERCDRFMKKTLNKRNLFLPNQKYCYECIKAMKEGRNDWPVVNVKGVQLLFHGYTPNKKSKTYGNQTASGWGILIKNFDTFSNYLKLETCGRQKYDKNLCNVK